jgi:subtilisin family serine protease
MHISTLRALLSAGALAALAAVSIQPVAALPALEALETAHDAKAAADGRHANNAYIVELAEPPVSAYRGGIPGLQATRPNRGEKLDPNSPAVINYRNHLEARQAAVLRSVGGGRQLHSYGYVFNGFAAELTAEQAARLALTPGVLAVSKDELLSLDTTSTPDFLGLSGPTGVWNAAGTQGEDVIIGIIDGGIWPESLSFADRTDAEGRPSASGKRAYRQIPGWYGRCVPGQAFNASHCNQKLIGARYYNAGWGGNAGISAQLPWEYNSPRDFGGHGTHVASTAGGNANTPTTGPAAVFASITGIAPRARIAAYKTCWETGSGGACFSSDSVAAIDQAVVDGVDVINYSVSGSRVNFRDPVEIAFLFAADAGVFVAASAGNAGPAVSTVAHPGPWLTTVAAGTHNRNGVSSTTLGNGSSYSGASFATALAAHPLVDSANVAAAGANLTEAELCYPGALDAAAVAGKVVLCKRGVIALVEKSRAVAEAGGAGMLLYNDPAGATNTLALFHSVPSVHLVAASGLAIKSYIAAAGGAATASIDAATVLFNEPAPFTANFSSRGPLQAGAGSLLKPDLIAPGQDILAAVAPPGNSGKAFDLYSGTSMSSPHVAGLAALFKQKYPSWSPMAIKSALMTTGYDVLDGGTPAPNTNPVLIFRQGAGHVDPPKALDPGLVFDAGYDDWLGFLCGTQLPASFCTSAGIPVLHPSDLNVASIAIGAMAGVQTVTRRVTNVTGAATSFSASHTGMTGFDVTISPASLNLAPGATAEFTVTFLRTTAALNAYTGGQLRWTDGTRTVRIPMVVRPVALAAPAEVSGSYEVTFGFTGPFTATPRGLVPSEVTDGVVSQDPDQTFSPADPTGTVMIPVIIPAGSTYARFALFDEDVTPGSDIDLYVYQGASLVGASTTATSTEVVSFAFANPTGGPLPLTVYVHGWGVAGGTSTPFKLHQWSLGTTAAGNMSVTAPDTATIGTTGTIGLGFDGLEAGVKYLGSVAYGGAPGLPAPTIVRIDPL